MTKTERIKRLRKALREIVKYAKEMFEDGFTCPECEKFPHDETCPYEWARVALRMDGRK